MFKYRSVWLTYKALNDTVDDAIWYEKYDSGPTLVISQEYEEQDIQTLEA